MGKQGCYNLYYFVRAMGVGMRFYNLLGGITRVYSYKINSFFKMCHMLDMTQHEINWWETAKILGLYKLIYMIYPMIIIIGTRKAMIQTVNSIVYNQWSNSRLK